MKEDHMEMSRKHVKKAGVVASVGAGGALLLACAACCAPLAAPLLAWLGVAGLTLMGPIGLGAAAIGALALVWMAVARRRRRAQCRIACRTGCSATCN